MSDHPPPDSSPDEAPGAKFERLGRALGLSQQAAFTFYNELKAASRTRATLEEITSIAAALPAGQKTKERILAILEDAEPASGRRRERPSSAPPPQGAGGGETRSSAGGQMRRDQPPSAPPSESAAAGETRSSAGGQMRRDQPPSAPPPESAAGGETRSPAGGQRRRIEWSDQTPPPPEPPPPALPPPSPANPARRRVSRLDRMREDLARILSGEIDFPELALPPSPPAPGRGRTPRNTAKGGSKPQPPKEARVDWANPAGGELDPASLVGVEDAYEHTPLLPGEKVAFCQYDRVAYHLETWNFLKAENQGRCCACGRVGTIRLVQLPGELEAAPGTAAPGTAGAKPEPRRVPAWMESGEEIIGLQQVHDYIGRAVIVEDFVTEVYHTKAKGTYYIRFEERQPGQPVFSGFKVVVFKGYQAAWERAGLDMRMYAGHRVRVRGIIQVHSTYGIQILINSPAMIQIVPKEG